MEILQFEEILQSCKRVICLQDLQIDLKQQDHTKSNLSIETFLMYFILQ